MNQTNLNRKSKDSVFVRLFNDKENILQLYKELHPEKNDITVDDIEIDTIDSIIINTQYNDLGFTVQDKYVLLIEAQSTWNPNMPIRILLYYAETLKRHIEKTQQSLHHYKKVGIPMPELYIFYSGDEEHPETVSFNDEFFNGNADIDLKVKVFSKIDSTIAGQYIGFCKVFDKIRKDLKNKDSLTVARETYKTCIEKGYLTAFMQEHEKEVVTIMTELFDEEYLREQYNRAIKEESRAEGRAEGKAEALKEALSNMIENGIDEAKAKMILGLN